MHPRVEEEWADFLEVYPTATYLVQPDRIQVELELEEGMYNRPTTPAAVFVPPGYRTTGPDGFLVPAGLLLAGGQGIPASDASGIGMPGWLLMSFHHIDEQGRSTWTPTADPRRGDNFISYFGSIESFLARSCN